ncbi:MAG: VOC family protein [Jatrophihabitans sp.]|uniref:VOC family protein n=1 Tax=Jatrophihabitans sp. TaxID=1932789 RepID=UPI003F7DF91A
MTADLLVADLAAATSFATDVLGLEHEDMGLDWVTRAVVPASGEHVQFVTADATAPESPVLTVKVDDVDEAYALAQQRGDEIVHPLTTEPWGIRRFFVRIPGGGVVNIAQEN